jgi:hypothetical protein
MTRAAAEPAFLSAAAICPAYRLGWKHMKAGGTHVYSDGACCA